MEEIGEGQKFHDEIAGLGLHLEKECPVPDDLLVSQCLDVREVLLQKEDVLPVQSDRLDRIPLTRLFFSTMPNHSMRPLSNLLPDGILILE